MHLYIFKVSPVDFWFYYIVISLSTRSYFNFCTKILYPKIYFILEKVPWAAEKSVYSVALGGIFCRCQLSPCGFILLFKAGVSHWWSGSSGRVPA
jgi:hypothetical protein